MKEFKYALATGDDIPLVPKTMVFVVPDIALFEIGTDVSAWLEKMKTEWEARLHSEWLDEFMEALQLWILSKT
jgi:hypothetical protein